MTFNVAHCALITLLYGIDSNAEDSGYRYDVASDLLTSALLAIGRSGEPLEQYFIGASALECELLTLACVFVNTDEGDPEEKKRIAADVAEAWIYGGTHLRMLDKVETEREQFLIDYVDAGAEITFLAGTWDARSSNALCA